MKEKGKSGESRKTSIDYEITAREFLPVTSLLLPLCLVLRQATGSTVASREICRAGKDRATFAGPPYVVACVVKLRLASAAKGEDRRLDVVARPELYMRTRRGYVVPAPRVSTRFGTGRRSGAHEGVERVAEPNAQGEFRYGHDSRPVCARRLVGKISSVVDHA